MHRVIIDDMPEPGSVYRIEGEEARHAVRVKRLEAGEPLELLDGCGHVGRAAVRGAEKSGGRGEWALLVDVESIEQRARLEPAVHVLAPAPKGDGLEQMIDGLTQVGAASWALLRTVRSVVEPREHRMDRLRRIAREAAKQCGRAWALEIVEPMDFETAFAVDHAGLTVVADAGGPGFAWPSTASLAAGARVLIGPEGGWEPRELEFARRAGAAVHRFGPHVMRIEVAAVVSTAIMLDRAGDRAGEATGPS